MPAGRRAHWQEDNFDTCTYVCANGRLDTAVGEQCDDGNGNDGDGCSSQCTVECGFSCRNFDPDTPSVCAAVCGDGLLASLETCDTALVHADADNPRGLGCSKACQVQPGWKCTFVAKCFETTNWTQVQQCAPACGDSLIIPPEECDDGDWNLPDKACLGNCRLNRGRVCYGPECMMPVPSSSVQQLQLMTALENGDGVSEGVFFMRGPDAFGTSSGSLLKSLTLFSDRASNTPAIFSSIWMGGLNLPQAAASSLGLTCPVCSQPAQTPWKASSGTILEEWNVLSNNVSCLYRIRPDFVPTVINLTISQLLINADYTCRDCVYFEIVTSIYNSPGKLVRRFNKTLNGQLRLYLHAPVDIAIFGIEHKMPLSDLLLRLNVTFSSLTKLTADQLICLSGCVWNSACSDLCFASKSTVSREHESKYLNASVQSRHLNAIQHGEDSDAFLQTRAGTRDAGQVLAMNFERISDPASSIRYPCQFSQFPSITGSMLLPVESKQKFVTDPWFEGTWQGTCSASGLICSLVVHIAGDTITKHAWDCPLSGYTVGRINSMDSDQTISQDDSFQGVYYKRAIIEWTRSRHSVDSVHRTYLSVFSSGRSSMIGPRSEKVLQILLEGALRTDLKNPRFLSGASFAMEDNCRVLTLQPSRNEPALKIPTSSISSGNDEQKYISCNTSMSKTVASLQGHSSDCLTLLRAFLLRDFWTPINLDISVVNSSFDYELLPQYTCSSPCLQRFRSELSAAADLCSSTWNTAWFNWEIGLRLFKLLISATSAIYWTSIMCPSNQNGLTCASTIIPPTRHFQGQGCQNMLPQSLYGPQFLLTQDTEACETVCVQEMESYVNELGCCSALIEQEGSAWLNRLTNNRIGWISVDFGDRSDPFNITFSNSASNSIPIYFENGISAGLKSGSHKMVHTVEPTQSMSVHDTLRSRCKQTCYWPEQTCCDALTCKSGTKSYKGACYCLCPEGMGGAQCDLQGYFAQLVLTFPGNTTFSYCEQSNLLNFMAQKNSLDKSMIEISPLSTPSRRLGDAQKTNVVTRMRQPSCDDTNRLTQKLASFFSTDTTDAFKAVSLSSPTVLTISTYCAGVKTICGWSGTSERVDSASVIAACTKAFGNNSVIAPTIPTTTEAPQQQWVVPVVASACVVCVLFIGAVISVFRSRIYVWFLICLESKHSGKYRKSTSSGVDSHTVQSTEIVFAKFAANRDPKALIISSPCDADEVEIDYHNEYRSPITVFHGLDSDSSSSSQSRIEGTILNLYKSPEPKSNALQDKEISRSPLYISIAAPANESVPGPIVRKMLKPRKTPVWSAFGEETKGL